MTLSDEKQGFSKRLKESLRRAKGPSTGPAGVAREFNLRYDGTPVTAQAVRKWLAGQSMPPQDKIRALALWLDVSPHWLRFGGADSKAAQYLEARQESPSYRIDANWLAKRFDALNEAHKKMVVEVLIALLRLEGKR